MKRRWPRRSQSSYRAGGLGRRAGSRSRRTGAVARHNGARSGANPDQFLLTYPDLLGSLPEIAAAESGQGAVDQGPDRDGITRSVPLFVFAGGNLVPDLALEMLRVATGARAVGIVAGANGVKGATLGFFFFPSDRNAASIRISCPSTMPDSSRQRTCSMDRPILAGYKARLCCWGRARQDWRI